MTVDKTDHDHVMALNVKVADLQQDSQEFKQMITKVDESIEKLTNITFDVSKILAVHEEKLNQHDKLYSLKHADTQDKINDLCENVKSMNKRIGRLERYFWIAFGGVTLTYWLVSLIHSIHPFSITL